MTAAAADDRHVWDTDDAGACDWLSRQANEKTRARVVRENLRALKRDRTVRKFRSLVDEMTDHDVMLEAGVMLAQKMDSSKRQDFLNSLRDILSHGWFGLNLPLFSAFRLPKMSLTPFLVKFFSVHDAHILFRKITEGINGRFSPW